MQILEVYIDISEAKHSEIVAGNIWWRGQISALYDCLFL